MKWILWLHVSNAHVNWFLDVSPGRPSWCQHGAFSGVGAIVASFVPAECPEGGGYVGYIRKALEKGYLEHPGSACCPDNMFEVFVPFGRCPCCLLPPFVNRQLPGSYHVCIQILSMGCCFP